MPIIGIVGNDHLQSEPLTERLADARTPEQARAILGRRRINAYALIGHGLTATFTAITLYLVVGTATGSKGPWVVGWLLPLAFVSLFLGSLSYGDIYCRVKGHQPPKPPMFIRLLDRLNRNI